MNGIRALVACLQTASAALEEPLVEQRANLLDLVGEEVSRVEPFCGGIRIRFGSGAAIVAPAGVLLDAAGNPVIEP